MEIRPDELLVDIERCREEMIELATNSPYSTNKVVDVSSKLDGLLNMYDTLIRK